MAAVDTENDEDEINEELEDEVVDNEPEEDDVEE